MNSHSGNLNTDSGKSKKVFSLKPESVFNLNQNRCSDWIRMGVQVEPEYARNRFLRRWVFWLSLQSLIPSARVQPDKSGRWPLQRLMIYNLGLCPSTIALRRTGFITHTRQRRKLSQPGATPQDHRPQYHEGQRPGLSINGTSG